VRVLEFKFFLRYLILVLLLSDSGPCALTVHCVVHDGV
jgi:hypothetical protein